ncbi:hypothetical protein G5I_01270 [Acromyrmex echinatior]|uniref:Uncharacterized protein n=1 Tax=Acromyrmex echinatior TaxID=103372 RepID=F4W761_ACREC|nr:hypothetical protein G5I_01270 [Acromyrmex echinatior]
MEPHLEHNGRADGRRTGKESMKGANIQRQKHERSTVFQCQLRANADLEVPLTNFCGRRKKLDDGRSRRERLCSCDEEACGIRYEQCARLRAAVNYD